MTWAIGSKTFSNIILIIINLTDTSNTINKLKKKNETTRRLTGDNAIYANSNIYIYIYTPRSMVEAGRTTSSAQQHSCCRLPRPAFIIDRGGTSPFAAIRSKR